MTDGVPYDELEPTMTTGSVVLLHGEFKGSHVIEWVTRSRWSHVGMVVRPSDIGIDFAGMLFWESNTLTDLPDVTDGSRKPGPMLVPLRERLGRLHRDDHASDFAYRAVEGLHVDHGAGRRLAELIPIAHTKGFPTDLEMVAYWLLGRFFRKRMPPDKVFCAEMIIKSYQDMGWMPRRGVFANGFDPRDFSQAGGEIPFCHDGRFGDEITVIPPEL